MRKRVPDITEVIERLEKLIKNTKPAGHGEPWVTDVEKLLLDHGVVCEENINVVFDRNEMLKEREALVRKAVEAGRDACAETIYRYDLDASLVAREVDIEDAVKELVKR